MLARRPNWYAGCREQAARRICGARDAARRVTLQCAARVSRRDACRMPQIRRAGCREQAAYQFGRAGWQASGWGAGAGGISGTMPEVPPGAAERSLSESASEVRCNGLAPVNGMIDADPHGCGFGGGGALPWC